MMLKSITLKNKMLEAEPQKNEMLKADPNLEKIFYISNKQFGQCRRVSKLQGVNRNQLN